MMGSYPIQTALGKALTRQSGNISIVTPTKQRLAWIGTQRTHGIKQLATNLSLKNSNIGKGELQGLQSNLRALCVSIGPFIYAWAFSKGIKIGRPALALVVSGMFVVLAERYHQKLKQELLTEKKD